MQAAQHVHHAHVPLSQRTPHVQNPYADLSSMVTSTSQSPFHAGTGKAKPGCLRDGAAEPRTPQEPDARSTGHMRTRPKTCIASVRHALPPCPSTHTTPKPEPATSHPMVCCNACADLSSLPSVGALRSVRPSACLRSEHTFKLVPGRGHM